MLERIREVKDQLPRAEAQVAELLLKHPHAFVRTPVVDIAAQAGVSQPTVVRFCRSLGTDGLREFKLKLAASLQLRSSAPHPSVDANDPLPDLAAKVVGGAVQSAQAVLASLHLPTVEAVVQALSQCRRVDFVGVGQSALVAQDARQKFFRFGLICEAQADPAMQVMSASLLGSQDLLVVISASGRSPELLDVIHTARQGGAKVLSIGAPASPIHPLADWSLSAELLDDPDVHMPMLSRLQHLIIIDVLAVALTQKLGDPAREQLAKVKRVLQQRRRPRQE
jgi:RpiR family transcriptional regulator, carbohydrate utilization regulator